MSQRSRVRNPLRAPTNQPPLKSNTFSFTSNITGINNISNINNICNQVKNKPLIGTIIMDTRKENKFDPTLTIVIENITVSNKQDFLIKSIFNNMNLGNVLRVVFEPMENKKATFRPQAYACTLEYKARVYLVWNDNFHTRTLQETLYTEQRSNIMFMPEWSIYHNTKPNISYLNEAKISYLLEENKELNKRCSELEKQCNATNNAHCNHKDIRGRSPNIKYWKEKAKTKKHYHFYQEQLTKYINNE